MRLCRTDRHSLATFRNLFRRPADAPKSLDERYRWEEGTEPMNESGQGNHGNQGSARQSVHPSHHPYWKRAHHDWRFWLGLVLMLAAIAIYVMSDDLAFLPHH